MAKENKIEFIHNLTELLHQTRAFETLIVEYGYKEFCGKVDLYSEERFVPCEDEDKLEWLLLRWPDQSPKYGCFVPVGGDSNWGIMIDAMKYLQHMA